MDFEEQLDQQHLFLTMRTCRNCGIEKNLIEGFYLSRKDRTKVSSYAYKCKECTLKRVKEYDKKIRQNYRMGKCSICKTSNMKLIGDVCKDCNKLIQYDIDILKNAVLYLKKSKI